MNKHRDQVVADKAHIVIDAPDVQLRNNKYYGNGVLLFGLAGKTVLDTAPTIAEGVKFPPGAKVADAGGLGAYVYYADTGNFVFREFHLPGEDEALAERIRQAMGKLEIAAEEKDPGARINAQVAAQMEIGDILVSAGDFDRARIEYQQAFRYPARDQIEWRSTIQIAIADSYMKQKLYPEAAAAYEEAQKIGVYGWRVEHVKTNLKQARELAGGKQL
jgi:tetratricopeptide (TPR) repeat protein